jgi:hypothetical protein
MNIVGSWQDIYTHTTHIIHMEKHKYNTLSSTQCLEKTTCRIILNYVLHKRLHAGIGNPPKQINKPETNPK